MSTEAVLSQVMSKIERDIPPEITNMCLSLSGMSTLDEFLQEVILKRYVLKEINSRTGKRTQIFLDLKWRVNQESYDIYNSQYGTDYYIGIYKIPPEARDNRPIYSAEVVTQMYNGFYGMGATSGVNGRWGVSLNSLADETIESRTFQKTPARPTVEVIGQDLLKIYPDLFCGYASVVCKIAYDVNFTNANPSFIDKLRQLVFSNFKMWIYTNFIVKIDSGEMKAGGELGVFKETVSSYQDQFSEYDNLLDKCISASDFDKSTMMNRIIKSL